MIEITNESSLTVVHQQVGQPPSHADAHDISACAVVTFSFTGNSENLGSMDRVYKVIVW